VLDLTASEARRRRARAQLLGGSGLAPAAVVGRAIALQGQDLPAVLRAIALRSAPGTTVADVRAAFDAGQLVRGWPMRGTLFATTPADLALLLSLTAERVRAATAPRRAQLGLEPTVIDRARELALAALGERGLSRAGMLAVWAQAGLPVDAGRGYHLISHLSIEGLVHWGPFDGAEQLLVRTPATEPVDPEEALVRVARGFLAARGPATVDDLAWWTKLPKTLVARAVAGLDGVERVALEGRELLLLDDDAPAAEPPEVALVPGFDEWILGYQDRSLVASPAMLAALVPGGNGVFRPAVLVDGVVVGIWRLASARRTAAAREGVLELVEQVPARRRAAIERAIAAWPHG